MKIEIETPRVDALIDRMMAQYPGMSAMSKYYEAVHQELAPLARSLERENARTHGATLRQQQAEQRLQDKTAKAAANYLRLADSLIKDRIRDYPEYDAACLALWDAPGIYAAMRDLQIELNPPKKHLDGCDI